MGVGPAEIHVELGPRCWVKEPTMAATDYAVSGRDTWADNSADQFVGVEGLLTTTATQADAAQEMSRGGTASRLRVRVVSSSVNGSVVVTLIKNGSATSLSVTISANTSSETAEDTTSSVSFSAGDELSWRIEIPTSSPASTDTTVIQWIACDIEE